MKENKLLITSRKFAIEIIKICNEIEKNNKNVLINQMLRSGTSIGANIYEANYASSKADFINKMQIALKECHETIYWLDIFKETNIIDEEKYQTLERECSKIRILLTSSLITAKKTE